MRNGHLGYINKLIHTDINSYEVFEDNGELKAVKVKRESTIKPEYISGGFSVICTNEEELYKDGNYKIVEDGKPFKIELKNGFYGFWHTDVLHFGWLDLNEMSKDEFIEANKKCGWDETKTAFEFGEIENNQLFYRQILLTKGGKYKRAFEKLGNRLDKECCEYYDRNF